MVTYEEERALVRQVQGCKPVLRSSKALQARAKPCPCRPDAGYHSAHQGDGLEGQDKVKKYVDEQYKHLHNEKFIAGKIEKQKRLGGFVAFSSPAQKPSKCRIHHLTMSSGCLHKKSVPRGTINNYVDSMIISISGMGMVWISFVGGGL